MVVCHLVSFTLNHFLDGLQECRDRKFGFSESVEADLRLLVCVVSSQPSVLAIIVKAYSGQ